MTDRFMQQHARPTVTQHYRHHAGGRVDCVQVHQRLTQRFARETLGFVAAEQFLVGMATAEAGAGRFAAAVVFHDHLHVHAHQRPDVAGHHAIAARDENGVERRAQRDHNLLHARIGGAQQPIDTAHGVEFAGVGVGVDRIDRRIQRGRRVAAGHDQRWRRAGVAIAGDGTRRARGGEQRVGLDFVGIREAGLFAGDRAHADALVDRMHAVLDDAIFHRPAFAARMLEIQIAEVDAGPEQQSERAFETGMVQPGRCEQARFGQLQHLGHGGSGVVRGWKWN